MGRSIFGVLLLATTCLLVKYTDGRRLHKRAAEAADAETPAPAPAPLAAGTPAPYVAAQTPAPAVEAPAPAPAAYGPVTDPATYALNARTDAPVPVPEPAQAPVQAQAQAQPAPAAYVPVAAPATDDAAARADEEEAPQVSGVAGALGGLPGIGDLLKETKKDKGFTVNWKGCKITIESMGEIINLDLTDEKCQDVVSIPKILARLSKKDGEKAEKSGAFAQLKKFNVKEVKIDRTSGDVWFTAGNKEPFNLMKGSRLKVKKSELEMVFNHKREFSFEDMGMNITGDVSAGKSNIEFLLNKGRNTSEGQFTFSVDSIKVRSLLKILSKKKQTNREEEDEETVGMFTKLELVKPKIRGTRDIKGNTEVVASATVTGIKGLDSAAVFVVAKKVCGRPTDKAVLVQIKQVKPAVIIRKLMKKSLDKNDAMKIPLINDVTADVFVTYASTDMDLPDDEEVVSLMADSSDSSLLEQGVQVKFEFPKSQFEDDAEEDVSPVDDSERYICVTILKDKMTFQVGNVELPFGRLMLLIAPKLKTKTFGKVFGNAKVTIQEFQYDSLTKVMNLRLIATNLLALGSGLLKLKNVGINLNRDEKNIWTFEIDAGIQIGDATMKLKMSKNGDKEAGDEIYKFQGSLDCLTTNDLIAAFSIKSAPVVTENKALHFMIRNVEAFVEFNSDGKTDMRVSGQVMLFDWQATFEAYFSKYPANEKTPSEFGFGLSMSGISVADVIDKMYDRNGEGVDLIDASWVYGQIAIMVGKGGSEGLKFEHPEIKTALARLTETMSSDVDVSKGVGMTLDADITVPQDCKQNSICSFLKKKLGVGAHLFIDGAISKKGVFLKAGIRGNIEISKKFTLKHADLLLKVEKSNVQFGLEGVCVVKFDTTEQTFTAKIAGSSSGNVVLEFSMMGEIWDKPFGLKYLAFGNFYMKVGMNVMTLLPNLEMGGELQFGHASSRIKAKLAGGFKTAGVPSFYVYAEFNELTISSILRAFQIETTMPKPLVESGFPEGLTAGIALPEGERIPSLGVDLEPGFKLVGKFRIFGITMMSNIQMNLPSEFHLEAQFDPIDIAGGLISLTGITGGDAGPYVKIDLAAGETNTLQVKIDARVTILKISVGVAISIGSEGFEFKVEGQVASLFQATLTVTAPYGEMSQIPANEWKIQGCVTTEVTDELKVGAAEEVKEDVDKATSLQKESEEITGETNRWFDKFTRWLEEKKMGLLETEAKMNGKLDKYNNHLSKLDPNCVEECRKEQKWYGGIKMVPCNIGSKQLQCPVWIDEKRLAMTPTCLATCEKYEWYELKGMYKSGRGERRRTKLAKWELEMEVKSKVINEIDKRREDFKPLIEFAEAAAGKVKEIGEMVKEAAIALKKFVVENLFYFKDFCVQATMAMTKGLCFYVDAEFYVGGKAGRKVLLDNKHICITKDFIKTVGYEIAKAAFNKLANVDNLVKVGKDFLSKSQDKANSLKEEGDAAVKRHDCIMDALEKDDFTKPCIRDLKWDRSKRWRTEEISDAHPEHVHRNDETMEAFRDIFSNETLETETGVGRDDLATPELKLNLNIDTASLRSTDPTHDCGKATAVMNAFSGILESVKAMADQTKKAKTKCNTFLANERDSISKLEKEIRNMSKPTDEDDEEFTDDDEEEALFYVRKAQKGIKSWKNYFNAQLATMERESLQSWRGFIASSATEQGVDAAALASLLDTASTETATRMDIPNTGTAGLTQSLAAAQQIVRSLLTKDGASFTSEAASIKSLGDEVSKMNALKSQMPCFKR